MTRPSERTAFKRGKKPFDWIKARSTGGCCFTVSFNRLVEMLKRGGTLEKGEEVERFEFGKDGITIFVTGGSRASTYRYLPLEDEF